MSPTDLAHFRTQLRVLLDLLGRRALADRRASATSPLDDTVGDDADQADRDGPRDLALRMGERDAGLAQRVQAALARIDDGSYGQCLECGREIERRRLELVPWAERCADDEEAFERARGETSPTL